MKSHQQILIWCKRPSFSYLPYYFDVSYDDAKPQTYVLSISKARRKGKGKGKAKARGKAKVKAKVKAKAKAKGKAKAKALRKLKPNRGKPFFIR